MLLTVVKGRVVAADSSTASTTVSLNAKVTSKPQILAEECGGDMVNVLVIVLNWVIVREKKSSVKHIVDVHSVQIELE